MKRMTMVKTRAMGLVLGVLLASVTVAGTLQGGPQGGPGGPGGPGGQGRGGRQGGPGGGFAMRGGPQSIAMLATRPDVARDLVLTQQQSEAIRAALESNRPAQPGLGGQRPDRDTMRAEMEARALALDKKVASILSAAQFTRLEEISIQVRGLTAALDPKIQTKLGLTDEQQQSLVALAQPPMRGPGGPGGPGGGPDGPPPNDGGQGGPPPPLPGEGGGQGGRGEGRGPGGRDGRRAGLEAQIARILTPAQIARLKALGGKTFVADEQEPGRRGPGGRGPGGPGGPGGPDEQAFFDGLLS